jgi:hypothetical protein
MWWLWTGGPFGAGNVSVSDDLDELSTRIELPCAACHVGGDHELPTFDPRLSEP